ncbi:MAG: GAF domain-containing sensor histidine kinase [Desulfobacterales bacterium]|nr:MAG: GAF domain-containing sensor histidine kinase [Desulfobacterales bacterium]
MELLGNFGLQEANRILRRSDLEESEQIQRLIKIRWLACALITAVVGLSVLGGFDDRFLRLLWAVGYILGYNLLYYRMHLRLATAPDAVTTDLQRSISRQAALDCGAVGLLAYFTGGISSPVSFLLVIPVIVVATRLNPRAAYTFAACVLAGAALFAGFEVAGWLPRRFMLLQPETAATTSLPEPFLFDLLMVWLTVVTIAFLGVSMSNTTRKKNRTLEDLCGSLTRLNEKFWRLFSMIQTIGSTPNLDQVLDIVSSQSAAVMNVKGISIKLLSEDGNYLRYAAAHGLPDAFVREKVVEVEKSPLNKRIIEGEPYITGNVSVKEMFQFGEVLAEAQIKSVLFLPLRLEGKVIGILGAYCILPDRFTDEDVDFFRLVAELVAIALENARAYEAVEKLVKERSWYMLRVAHNLRAPLAGMLSILDVVRGGYLGALNDEQLEYLRRLDRRSRTMLMLVNELMTLAKSREEKKGEEIKTTDPELLTRRIRRTFQERAAEKNIAFSVAADNDLPFIRGDLEMVEQILENLVSNAIKYTLADGTVTIKLSQAADMIRMEISDSGIGIPKADRSRLFTEFFRAENARAVEKTGTGLGLAIVREFVDKLGGRILVESEEGMGTIFVVDLPTATHEKGGQHDSGATN